MSYRKRPNIMVIFAITAYRLDENMEDVGVLFAYTQPRYYLQETQEKRKTKIFLCKMPNL